MSSEVITFLTAATPISELRGAIPMGIGFGFSSLKTYILAVAGNGFIILPLMFFLQYGADWSRRHIALIDRILNWTYERTRRNYGAKFESAGMLALAIFVAIPLPMTGAWTACVIAIMCKLPFWKSAVAILLGVMSAGVIVLSLTQGIIHIF